MFLFANVRLGSSYFFLIEGNERVKQALESSWNATDGQAWTLALAYLVGVSVVIAGLIALVIGAVPAAMIALAAFAAAYRQMAPARFAVSDRGEHVAAPGHGALEHS